MAIETISPRLSSFNSTQYFGSETTNEERPRDIISRCSSNSHEIWNNLEKAQLKYRCL